MLNEYGMDGIEHVEMTKAELDDLMKEQFEKGMEEGYNIARKENEKYKNLLCALKSIVKLAEVIDK